MDDQYMEPLFTNLFTGKIQAMLKQVSFQPKWLWILFVVINLSSCGQRGDETSSVTNQSSIKQNGNSINQDYKDLYSCFGVDSLLKKERHYFLIAGQELEKINAFFFSASPNHQIYFIDVFQFRLAKDQDTIIFKNVCEINHIIYDKIEFIHLKRIQLQKKDALILNNIKSFESESHLGKLDPFFIKLCEYSHEKEIHCVTVYKGGGSSIEKFYDQLISM